MLTFSVQKYTSKAAYIRAIIDHHYASFTIYANPSFWSGAKRKEGTTKPRKKEMNKQFTLYLQSTLSLKKVLDPSASTGL